MVSLAASTPPAPQPTAIDEFVAKHKRFIKKVQITLEDLLRSLKISSLRFLILTQFLLRDRRGVAFGNLSPVNLKNSFPNATPLQIHLDALWLLHSTSYKVGFMFAIDSASVPVIVEVIMNEIFYFIKDIDSHYCFGIYCFNALFQFSESSQFRPPCCQGVYFSAC